MKYLVILLMLCGMARAQLWNGIVSPARAVDWSHAGATIPNRTVICQTLAAGSSSATINTAISNCAAAHTAPGDAGGIVVLNAGSYALTTGISFVAKSNVTVRGAGADQTLITISANANCYFQAAVCMEGNNSGFGKAGDTAPDNTASWTASSYTKGINQITLTAIHGSLGTLTVGDPMVIDQCIDGVSGNTSSTGFGGCTTGSQADTGQVYNCNATNSNCTSNDGPSGVERPNRVLGQVVTVTNIAGNVVTFTPALEGYGWAAARSPEAFWTSLPIFNNGLENLSIDFTGLGTGSGVMVHGCNNCWVKGIRSIYRTRTGSERNQVMLLISNKVTISDSYFYGSSSLHSEGYGVEFAGTSDCLVENNILQQMPSVLMQNSYASGCVVAYNFSINDANDASFLFNAFTHHGPADNMLLEGNIGNGYRADIFHGSHTMNTTFRNYWNGWESTSSVSGGEQPYFNDGIARYFNAIGNVLGHAGTQTVYQCTPSSCPSGDAIFELGTGGATGHTDTLTVNSQMRWGNYSIIKQSSDTPANSGIRFVASEVPSAFNDTSGTPSLYVNSVPVSQTLPASFYLSAKPSWWPSTTPWPPIGPDVVSGNVGTCSGGTYAGNNATLSAQCTGGSKVTALDGHANSIPAMDCFLGPMAGPPNGANAAALTFNAVTCYGAVAGAPAAPTSLAVTVH